MSRYVPSFKRRVEMERRSREDAQKKAEEERIRQAELNEVNFPSLASTFASGTKASAWAKSGKELAQAWKEADEQQDQQKKADAYLRQQEAERDRRDAERCLRIPRFRVQAQEDTYYEDEDDQECNGGAGYSPPPRDDWERVQKKTRVRKENHPIVADGEPDSVWEEDQEHLPSEYDWTARPGRRNNDSLY